VDGPTLTDQEHPVLCKPATIPPGAAGWTLIEALLVIMVIGIIATIAVPEILNAIARAKIRRAIADMRIIDFEIDQLADLQGTLPQSLADLPPRPRIDPWGHPYVYFLFQGPGWKGKARKDRFLVPINSTYDLYSIGLDAQTRPPLQHPRSLDDVVRANDGQFYGLGRDF
jgi:general secretion pathway protein G